jgi:hypothetical protein
MSIARAVGTEQVSRQRQSDALNIPRVENRYGYVSSADFLPENKKSD